MNAVVVVVVVVFIPLDTLNKYYFVMKQFMYIIIMYYKDLERGCGLLSRVRKSHYKLTGAVSRFDFESLSHVRTCLWL